MAIRIYQQQPDSLEQLASKINCAHERIAVALRRTWEEGKIVGQWLIEAKAKLNQHGQWKKWVADNLIPSLRTCQGYMKSTKEEKAKPFFYGEFGQEIVHPELNGSWQTRKRDFDKFNAVFHFTIDACASKANALLPRYWTKQKDCLKQDWTKEIAYCNPPFAGKHKFVAKASTARTALVVLPVIALTAKYLADYPPKVLLIPPYRLKFDSPPETPKLSRPTIGVVLLVYGKVPDNLDQLGFMVARC